MYLFYSFIFSSLSQTLLWPNCSETYLNPQKSISEVFLWVISHKSVIDSEHKATEQQRITVHVVHACNQYGMTGHGNKLVFVHFNRWKTLEKGEWAGSANLPEMLMWTWWTHCGPWGHLLAWDAVVMVLVYPCTLSLLLPHFWWWALLYTVLLPSKHFLRHRWRCSTNKRWWCLVLFLWWLSVDKLGAEKFVQNFIWSRDDTCTARLS